MVETHNCEKCSAVFESWYYKDKHERDEHSELFPFECPGCSDTFKSEKGVRTHYKQSHGKSLSNEEVECEICGTSFHETAWKRRRNNHHFCSPACYAAFRSEHYCGEDNPRWNGGNVKYGSNWYEMRQKVRERDEVCQSCEEDGEKRLLDVHHITPIRKFDIPEEANKMDNLVLLCRGCHSSVENGQLECPNPEEAW